MTKEIDEFLKEYRKENNTEDAIYSSYHLDFAEAWAKYRNQELESQLIENKSLRDIIDLVYTVDGDESAYKVIRKIDDALEKLDKP